MRTFWCLFGGRKLLHKSLFLLTLFGVVICVTFFSLQNSIAQDNVQLYDKGETFHYVDRVEMYQGQSKHNLEDQGKKLPRSLINTNSARLLKQLRVEEDSQWNSSTTLKSTYPNVTGVHSVISKKILHNTEVAHLDLIPSQDAPDSLKLLQQTLLKRNEVQRILNEDKFPPLADGGLVLIVQVHKREGYLKQLLESLKAAKGIENVLLVISHDYYYDDMNAVVESVDFCKVSETVISTIPCTCVPVIGGRKPKFTFEVKMFCIIIGFLYQLN